MKTPQKGLYRGSYRGTTIGVSLFYYLLNTHIVRKGEKGARDYPSIPKLKVCWSSALPLLDYVTSLFTRLCDIFTLTCTIIYITLMSSDA